MEVVLEMFLLTLSNADKWFVEQEFVWRIYSAAKTLPKTQRIEIISKKKFATSTLNKEDKTFVVYMATLSVVDSNIHLSRQAQISLLDIKEVIIPSKYADYTNVFSQDSAAKFREHTGINDYSIKLINDKPPLYSLIYSL